MTQEDIFTIHKRAELLQGCAMSQLVERFPRIFHGSEPSVPSTLSPGWRDLVFDLFAKIDGILSDEDAAKVRVGQVKEKFGELRIYLNGLPRPGRSAVVEHETNTTIQPAADGPQLGDRVQALINDATKKSRETCELCGAAGRIQGVGYIKCRCTTHADTSWEEWNLGVLAKAEKRDR